MEEKNISIIDYGMGNLRSIQKAFESFGVYVKVTSNSDEILNSRGIILPGVGAFKDAVENIKKMGIEDTIYAAAKREIPILGICLGMQLLFEESDEVELTKGLGLIAGRIEKLKTNFKIPHMGWNNLKIVKESPLLKAVKSESYVYFVHSYYANTDEKNVYGYASYGCEVPAVVGNNKNIYGVQFHPEKSGDVGIKMLKNFNNICNR